MTEPSGAGETPNVPTPPPFGSSPGGTGSLPGGLGGEQYSQYGMSNDYSMMAPQGPLGMPPAGIGNSWYTQMATGSQAGRRSARTPGTGLPDDMKFLQRRSSSRLPGSAGMNPVDATRYDINTVPSSFGWGTGFASERATQSEYENNDLGTAIADLYNRVNGVHDRVNVLDDRSRAQWNYDGEVTMAIGDYTVEYTTAFAYTSEPGIRATSLAAGWETGFSISSMAQNGNGTWTGTVTSNAAAVDDGGGLGSTVGVDVKGPTSEDEDLD